jgi:hypothetical protein
MPNNSPEPPPIAVSVPPSRLTDWAARLGFCRWAACVHHEPKSLFHLCRMLPARLLLGVGGACFFGMAYSGKKTADGLALIKEMEIAEAGQNAFAAYQQESRPVAIYALNQYLDSLQKLEEMVGTNPVFMTKMMVNFDSMLTHARLAKLYAEAGKSDLSTQQVAEALKCASQDGKLLAITNQATLTEILARVDKGAAK